MKPIDPGTQVAAALLGTLLLFAAGARAAEPVAMVTDVTGGVTVVEAGKSSKLSLLAYLAPGAELKLDPGARVVVTYFAKSVEYAFSGPATVLLQPDGAQAKSGAAAQTRKLDPEQSASAKKFEPLARERVAMATFEMRGAARARLRVIGPADTRVLTTQPELAWSALTGVKSYRLHLADAGGATLHDGAVGATHWRVPEALALKRGASYQWKVEAVPPSGETQSVAARFSVLDAAEARRIAAAQPKPGAAFSERVLYAAMLESEGLGYDAQAAWRALARERPDDPTLARWAGM